MKVMFVFDDWRNREGKSIYQTEEGIKLSAGDFHSGTIFNGEIWLDEEQMEDLLNAIKVHKARPIFEICLNEKYDKK